MSDKLVRLIDMEDDKSWRRFGIGESWRAARAVECDICGCLSNEFKMTGGMYGSRRATLVCPGKEQEPELHSKLKAKVMNLSNDPDRHPAAYITALAEEVAEAREQFRRDVAPNVAGLSDRGPINPP